VREGSPGPEGRNQTYPSFGESLEDMEDVVDEEWECFSNPSCDVVPSGEEDESSFLDTASMLGKCHINYCLS
jgi:hypothetical protein